MSAFSVFVFYRTGLIDSIVDERISYLMYRR